MAEHRRKNDEYRGRLLRDAFSAFASFPIDGLLLFAIQLQSFQRHEDYLPAPQKVIASRLDRRSMGVDSFRWITLEIENDALETSYSLRISPRSRIWLANTGYFYLIPS